MRLVILIIAALLLRLVGINWDNGFHLHPDERMLLMVADRIRFFGELNPNFFNYGTLPIYLLKGVAQFYDLITHSHIASYAGMLILGRILSMSADLLTIFFIYKISRELFRNDTVETWGCIFYAIAFFPIQNSHFFIADTFLTCFITMLFWRILLYLKRPSSNTIFYIAITFSFALATKFTAVLFLPFLTVLFLFHLNKREQLVFNPLKQSIIQIFIFYILSSIFFFLFMPYAVLEFGRFYKDITYQMQMNSNPYIFPYTLQYVNTLLYVYPLKHIILWGLGPIISILSLTGIILIGKNTLGSLLSINLKVNPFGKLRIDAEQSRSIKTQNSKLCRRSRAFSTKSEQLKIQNYYLLLVFFTFYFFYFIIIGRSAVKFMRYMLPLYPFLAMMAGYTMYKIQNLKFKIQNFNSKFPLRLRSEASKIFNFKLQLLTLNFKFLTYGIFIFSLGWTIMFVNIYSQTHTRIKATEWILKNIPKGKTLAVEHWDDRLPLVGSENYTMVELPLYDLPDDERKWGQMNERIASSDYIIIASNRLFTPLQKLSDCQTYENCYPLTANYYKKLFAGNARFAKVAEFSVYPGIKIGNTSLTIKDDAADESFTVYDHPHIFIFKKI